MSQWFLMWVCYDILMCYDDSSQLFDVLCKIFNFGSHSLLYCECEAAHVDVFESDLVLLRSVNVCELNACGLKC